MDSNLLLSVIGGLGRWDVTDDNQQIYLKDDDCLGMHSTAGDFMSLSSPFCVNLCGFG